MIKIAKVTTLKLQYTKTAKLQYTNFPGTNRDFKLKEVSLKHPSPQQTTTKTKTKMYSNCNNALRVVINHSLNDKQKKLHDDSAELAQLKIDAPVLFLGYGCGGNYLVTNGRVITMGITGN